MPGFGVVRLHLRALFEGSHLHVELALTAVIAGEHFVGQRIGRLDLDRLLEHGLRFVVAAVLFVELAERLVVRGLIRLGGDQLLGDRHGLFQVVDLLGAVRRDEVFERQLQDLGGLRFLAGLQLVDRQLVVRDGLLEVGVVLRIALLRGLVYVVVAVAQEEVGIPQIGIELDGAGAPTTAVLLPALRYSSLPVWNACVARNC